MIYLCFTDTLLLLYARVIMLYSCFTHDLLVLYSCFKERVGVVGVFLVLYSSLLMLYSYSTRAEQIFFTRFFSLIDYSKTLLYSHGRLPGALQIFRLFFITFFPPLLMLLLTTDYGETLLYSGRKAFSRCIRDAGQRCV